MAKNGLIVLAVILALAAGIAQAAPFENKKILQALQSDVLKVGMTKEQLIEAIGYPPEGKPVQDAKFYRFTQSKVTAAGKEESWTYQIAPTFEGVRSVTFKIVNGKVTEWNEWLDTNK